MYPCPFHAPKIASESEFQNLLALHQVVRLKISLDR